MPTSRAFLLVRFTMTHIEQRNQEATLYVGDLDTKVDESVLWELMLQAGPVGKFLLSAVNISTLVNVFIPRDKLTREHGAFGFVEFASEIVSVSCFLAYD